MDKVRIYELAKELNTTSKRLIEKLAEINITVKNHMSFLEDHELQALYKHIGVIQHHDEKKAADAEEKKVSAPVQPKAEVKPEAKKELKKDVKSAPRIIRTTEIILDSGTEKGKAQFAVPGQDKGQGVFKGGERNGKGAKQRREIIRTVDPNAGLRAGFVRDTGHNFLRDIKAHAQVEESLKKEKAREREQEKEQAKTQLKEQGKEQVTARIKDPQREQVIEHAKEQVKEQIIEQVKEHIKEQVKEHPNNRVEEQLKDQVKEQPKGQAREREWEQLKDKPGYGQKTEAQRDFGKKKAKEAVEVRHEYKEKEDENRQKKAADGEDKSKGLAKERTQDFNKDRSKDFGKERNRDFGKDRSKDFGKGESGKKDDRQQAKGYGDVQKHDYPKTDRRRPGDREQKGKPADRMPHGAGALRPVRKILDIPKPEISVMHKDDLASQQRSETRREFLNRDVDKDIKREQKKDIPKTQLVEAKDRRFKPQTAVLREKKGVSEILSEDFILEEFYSDDEMMKAAKRALKAKRDLKGGQTAKKMQPKVILPSITIPETITVKDLAEALKKTSAEVIKRLMDMGIMATLNQEIDYDTAAIIADEFGIKAEKEVVVNEEDILFDDSEGDVNNQVPRPPVVVVMGHVDHGKTLLLDAIRKTNVIDTEAGGITQHIGAYMVKINDRHITFLDTPGHEAFTSMRARGAKVTDIAVLVVAADDGVMPQTIEAINHAKAANVSIVVAINKIDKPEANPDRVKQQLTEYGLVPEEWGGDVIFVPVSAKRGDNIDHLLEMILLAADVLELKADPNKQAKGTVIEAKLDKNRGPIATLLVQRGTLNVGDSIVTGTTVGRIRAMTDDKGNQIKQAGPSTPVEILGLPDVPEAGETFYAIEDEKIAKQLAEKRKLKIREQQLKSDSRVSLNDLFSQIKEGKVKDLNIIVKADVQGSVEAVRQSLGKLSNEEVRIRVIHDGVGAITESDVALAQVSNAIIIGFNVRPGANVMEAAANAKVDIRLYRIIYNAIEDIEAAMKGMLEPTFREVMLGQAEIRQVFKISGVGSVAGCYVTEGKIVRNADVRIVRNGIVVHEGKLASLKRFKDDVREVAQGFECGMSIEKYNDIKEGDIIEAFTMEKVEK